MAKSFLISVSLGAGCYRHIKIAADAVLERLSDAILNAFEFENDHAHAFFMDNRAWSNADSYMLALVDEFGEDRHTCDYTLDDAGLITGKKFLYLFDFGDEWRFPCRVLKELDELVEAPVVIRSNGEPPLQYDWFDEDEEEDEEQ